MELLAPAGSPEALTAAVQAGADAVYLGYAAYSARAGAGNFDEQQLRDAVRFAHLHHVRVHVTVNTLIKDGEMSGVVDVLRLLSEIRVDAVLVQDLGVLRMARRCFPDLPIHASTQMAIHNATGVRFCRNQGMTRAVLARECSAAEIALAAKEGIEIEVFGHGAQCVAVSGECLFSSVVGGRSGNRGRCAQPCRLLYTYRGKTAAWLSPRDVCMRDDLPELNKAGVASIKLEGRLKRPEYVATIANSYRNAIDAMTTETTCLSSIWETDETTHRFLAVHGRAADYKKLAPADLAYYDGVVEVDLSAIRPMIALPMHPSNAFTIEELNANLEDILHACEQDVQKLIGRKDVSLDLCSKIENGKADIPQAKVELFANALHTTTAYLMGVDGPALPPGCEPLPCLKRLPLVGRIACGMPILAEQNIEGEVAVPEAWHADFILTCRGDSMAPQIMDGDLVAVRSQPEVENGEIAVVRIGDEATLKKVSFDGTTMVLQPLNPAYPLMTYTGAALAEVHIEGKAVGLCRGL